jgi:hypothetical protein
MSHRLYLHLAGWIGLVMAVIIGGAIAEPLAFPFGAAWIFICLFDRNRGGHK